MDAANTWDLNDLSVFAGKFSDVKSFRNTVPKTRQFRDGRPPTDGIDPDPAEWLTGFWDDLKSKGLAGFREIAGYALPEPHTAVADLIKATHVSPQGPMASWLDNGSCRIYLSLRVDEEALTIRYIIVSPQKNGWGTNICSLLAEWAKERNLLCRATSVTQWEFFAKIGWTELAPMVWEAPHGADPFAGRTN